MNGSVEISGSKPLVVRKDVLFADLLKRQLGLLASYCGEPIKSNIPSLFV